MCICNTTDKWHTFTCAYGFDTPEVEDSNGFQAAHSRYCGNCETDRLYYWHITTPMVQLICGECLTVEKNV